jgi:hypothetical protein
MNITNFLRQYFWFDVENLEKPIKVKPSTMITAFGEYKEQIDDKLNKLSKSLKEINKEVDDLKK